MRKKELLAAAVDRRMDYEMQQAAIEMQPRRYKYHKEEMEYRYGRLIAADIIWADNAEILQISVWVHDRYSWLMDVPKYYIFIDREKNHWINYELAGGKWRTAKIDNLDWGWHWNAGGEVYESGETTLTIQRYLRNAKNSGFQTIRKFMEKSKTRKEFNKYLAEINDIDRVMKQVPKIPKGFEEWALDDGLEEHRYIYYTAGRKVTHGWCTHCRKMVSLSPGNTPKHNKHGICPACNSIIMYKADKKAAKVEDWGTVILFQKMKERGFVIRIFSVFRSIGRECYTRPYGNITERKRIILNEWMREARAFVWDEYPVIKKRRWCNSSGYYNDSGRIFPCNLDEQLKESNLCYLPLTQMLKKINQKIDYTVKFFRRAEDYHRAAEYLMKCRLYTMALEFLQSDRLELGGHLNVNADGILKCLNINREQLRLLQKYDGGGEMMRIITRANRYKVRMTDEQIGQMYKEHIDWKFIEYMSTTTPHKMLRYISRCTNKGEYLDYLNMRKENGYDMKDTIILYPKDLTEAHHKMVLETNKKEMDKRIMEVKAKFPHIEEKFEELDERYHYEYKDYSIRPAQDAGEIVREGKLLHHCVGGDNYLRKHDKGESIILMLRKKEHQDIPWYTVEYGMKEKKVIQYYAEKDTQPLKDVVSKWLDRWLKEIEKREKKAKIPIAV